MLKTETQLYIDDKPDQLRNLYDKYSGMLLGYIFGVVNDQKIAEDHLIRIFSELSQQSAHLEWEAPLNWCQLLRFAKNQLKQAADTVELNKFEPMHRFKQDYDYLSALNDEQIKVFHDVYYLGKTTNTISLELNKPEVSIRKTLKEAFAVIKKGCEN